MDWIKRHWNWLGVLLGTLFGSVLGFGFGAGFAALALAGGWFERHRPEPVATWGKFSEQPTVTFLDDGRTIQLLKDFAYTDSQGKTWLATAGLKADGASIPQAFWSVTGGPLTGQFRNASIVHDMECDLKREKWEDVHLMFYEACRCGGVPENRAKAIYAAVYHFGPRWQKTFQAALREITLPDGSKRTIVDQRPTYQMISPPQPTDVAAHLLEAYINEKNPSLEDLQKLDLKQLQLTRP